MKKSGRHNRTKRDSTIVDTNSTLSRKLMNSVLCDDYQKTCDLLEHSTKNIINRPCNTNGETPIFFARNQKMAKLLVNHGADVHIVTNNGRSLLMHIIHLSNHEGGIDLLQYYLNKGVSTAIRDRYGDTVLHYIARCAGDYDTCVNCIKKVSIILEARVLQTRFLSGLAKTKEKEAKEILKKEWKKHIHNDICKKNGKQNIDNILAFYHNEKLLRKRINCWVVLIKVNQDLPVSLPLEMLILIKNYYRKIWFDEHKTHIHGFHTW